MHYEWNAKKARRKYFLKILATWTAAVVLATLPVIMAVSALTF